MSRAWEQGWYDRIYAGVRKRGFADVSAYVASAPCRSWTDLARDLDRGNIAGVQLRAMVYDEALKRHDIVGFAKSCFVRELHKWVPHGWSKGDKFRSDVSGAYACWITSLEDSYKEHADRAWSWLEMQDIPEGWLPQGPDDPWIEAMFRETGFTSADKTDKPSS